MGKRLYVGNLNFQTTEQALRQLFERDGRQVVDCKVVSDRETGRSRGFAFVEMNTDEEAQGAIKALDGFEVDGRALRVNEARDREQRGPGGGGGGGRRGPNR